jgi:hypothetical protein
LADHVPAGLTPREGRRFGLTVGVAFLVFGSISRWRGHAIAPFVLWSLGGGLTLLGALIPGRLGPIYRAWMGLAHLLSRVTTPLFMGIVYFLVITPMGFLQRLFGRNPLVHPDRGGSYWISRTPRSGPDDSMRNQF